MKNREQAGCAGENAERGGSLSRSFEACRNWAAKIGQMKDRFIERLYLEVMGQIPEDLFKKAVMEAEALAGTTGYSLLLLPVLAEEKVASVRQWTRHQREIQARH